MTAARVRLRGLASLLLLVGLLVGIPLALVALFGTPPLPHTVPSFDTIKTTLQAPTGEGFLLGVVHSLAWVGWVAWATFAFPVLVEAAATIRGISAPTLPALGLQQRSAAALVSGALLLLTAGTAVASPLAATASAAPATAGTSVSTSAGVVDTAARTAVPAWATAPAAPAAGPMITVAHGDTLWDLAVHYLGDGSRYGDIAQLNYGHPQADGAALDGGHWLHPGWVLQLPAAAPAAAPDGAITVAHGDTLWDLAATHLGDGSRFTEITDATGVPLPSTILTVGQHLLMPGATPAPTPAPPAPQVPQEQVPQPAAVPTPPPAPAPPVPAPSAQPPAEQQLPATPAPEPPAATQPAQPPAAAPEPAPAQISAAVPGGEQHSPAPTAAHDAASTRSLIGLTGIAATALLTGLGLARRRQQRRRKRGESIPLPTGDAAISEAKLRAAAQPLQLHQVDTALRGLTVHYHELGRPLPALLAVRLHDDSHLEAVFLDTVELPAPWTRTYAGTWSITPATSLDTPTPAVTSPYPSLVCIGTDPDGAQVLINLEETGQLGIHAHDTDAADICRALAVELAVSPLADDLLLTLVGTCQDLPAALDNGRVQYADTLDTILDSLDRHAGTDRTHLTATGMNGGVAQARTADDGDPAGFTTPQILLITTPVTDTQQAQLDRILTDQPRLAIAVITQTATRAPWALHLDDTGEAQLQRAGVTAGFALTPQRLTAEAYASIVKVMATATTPPTNPQPTAPDAQSTWTAERIDTTTLTAAPAATDIPRSATTIITLPWNTTPPKTAGNDTETDTVAGDAPEHTYREGEAPLDTPVPDDIAVADSAPEQATEPAPGPEAETAVSTADPAVPHLWIRVLGEPTVSPPSGKGPAEPDKRGQLTELACLLAMRPGISSYEIDALMWPISTYDKIQDPAEQRKAKTDRRNQAISRLRTWLGDTPSGNRAVATWTKAGGYRLDDELRTDWDHWQLLVGNDPTQASTRHLTHALDLVTAQPFTHPTNPTKYVTKYDWAEYNEQEMISRIADAAEELAARHLHHGDVADAHATACRGLAIEPNREGLWRIAILAAHASNDPDTAQDLIYTMLEELDGLGGDMETATTQLLHDLKNTHTDTGENLYRITG